LVWQIVSLWMLQIRLCTEEIMPFTRKLFLLVFACSCLLAAENPFVGTWKENVNKSTYFNQPAAESAVIRIESAGDKGVKIIQEIVMSTGRKGQTVEVSALDGCEDRPTAPSGENSNVTRSFRSISPDVWERILKAPGDIRHGYWAVSSDRKMLIITGFGKSPNGQEYYFHRVLERQ
jgi:hypothetical protein